MTIMDRPIYVLADRRPDGKINAQLTYGYGPLWEGVGYPDEGMLMAAMRSHCPPGEDPDALQIRWAAQGAKT